LTSSADAGDLARQQVNPAACIAVSTAVITSCEAVWRSIADRDPVQPPLLLARS